MVLKYLWVNLIFHFNPRSPWGERPLGAVKLKRALTISIHALREESDDYFVYLLPLRERFQSTLSVRRATIGGGKTKAGTNNFNPRSPWGERHWRTNQWISYKNFNPRSPWGERQSIASTANCLSKDFNPRSPWGERRGRCKTNTACTHSFQSTLSVRRATHLFLLI